VQLHISLHRHHADHHATFPADAKKAAFAAFRAFAHAC
jgi:hypothetical protein